MADNSFNKFPLMECINFFAGQPLLFTIKLLQEILSEFYRKLLEKVAGNNFPILWGSLKNLYTFISL